MEFVLNDGSTILINPDKLLPDSRFRVQWNSGTFDYNVLSEFPANVMRGVIEFVTTGKIRSGDSDFYNALEFYLSLEFNYLNEGHTQYDYPDIWMNATQEEAWIRNRFYAPGFEWLHRDNEYNLIRIDEAKFAELSLCNGDRFEIYEGNKPRLLKGRAGTVYPGNTPAKSLEEWKSRIGGKNVAGVVIAGGSLISLLNGDRVVDNDLFVYGGNDTCGGGGTGTGVGDESTVYFDNKLREILENNSHSITRSVNAVTINSGIPTQIILRAYKTMSEIIHGFDIDCSGICYNIAENEIYVTPRAWFALTTRTNVVNLSLASPTYEYRLAKYRHRGFSIYVPGLDKKCIDKKATRSMRRFVNETLAKIMPMLVETFSDARQNIDERGNKYRYGADGGRASHKTREIMKRRMMINLKTSFRGLSYLLMMDKLKYIPFELSDYDEIKEIDQLSPTSLGELGQQVNFPGKTALIDEFENIYTLNGASHLVLMRNEYDRYRRPIKVHGCRGIEGLFFIPDEVVDKLKPKVPQKLTWKTTYPGEQMTSTFHRTVYTNPDVWYNGLLYHKDRMGRMDRGDLIRDELLELYLTVSKMYLDEPVDPVKEKLVTDLLDGRNLFTAEVFSDLMYYFLIPNDVKDKRPIVPREIDRHSPLTHMIGSSGPDSEDRNVSVFPAMPKTHETVIDSREGRSRSPTEVRGYKGAIDSSDDENDDESNKGSGTREHPYVISPSFHMGLGLESSVDSLKKSSTLYGMVPNVIRPRSPPSESRSPSPLSLDEEDDMETWSLSQLRSKANELGVKMGKSKSETIKRINDAKEASSKKGDPSPYN
jgi:hypothetical protein